MVTTREASKAGGVTARFTSGRSTPSTRSRTRKSPPSPSSPSSTLNVKATVSVLMGAVAGAAGAGGGSDGASWRAVPSRSDTCCAKRMFAASPSVSRTRGLHVIVSVTLPLASRATGLGGAIPSMRGAMAIGSSFELHSFGPRRTMTATV